MHANVNCPYFAKLMSFKCDFYFLYTFSLSEIIVWFLILKHVSILLLYIVAERFASVCS